MKGAKLRAASDRMSPLVHEYATALASYLTGDGEPALRRAYEFGRSALRGGLGVLEIALLHHQSLQLLTPKERGPAARRPKFKTAGEFLAESLSVYEMAFRGFKEKNAALRHLNDVLEKEARRIAYLLHDEVGQSLFAAQLSLAQLEGKIDASLRQDMRTVSTALQQIGEQLRTLSHEMRPTVLDDLGLGPALEFLSQGVSKRSAVSVTIRSSVQGRLPSTIEATLFRAVQEALSNVVRHSNAAHAEVVLERKGQTLFCTVTDAGIGFDVDSLHRGNSEGLGLSGIRERLDSVGGTLEIRSQPGQGTELIMIIPCEV
jgi:two-component system, NarL family, sensor histidine kinase UhpB